RDRKAQERLDLCGSKELQPDDPEVAGDLRGVLSRNIEERGREGIENHLLRHPHLADDPGHRGHDSFLLGVVRVTQWRGGLELDDDEAAEWPRRLIELPGVLQDGLQARDERETTL